MWSSLEGPRALFDRAVVWLIGSQVLLPGITTLARMVAEVRQEENDRLYATLYRATPRELRTEMARLLEVPEKRRVSELERLRLGPMRISGGRCSTPSNAPARCGISALARSTSRRSRQPG